MPQTSRIASTFGTGCDTTLTVTKLIEAVRLLGYEEGLVLSVNAEQLSWLDRQDIESRNPKYRDGRLIRLMDIEISMTEALRREGDFVICRLAGGERVVEIECLGLCDD